MLLAKIKIHYAVCYMFLINKKIAFIFESAVVYLISYICEHLNIHVALKTKDKMFYDETITQRPFR